MEKFHITQLQSGCRGQAAPPFKQLLCGRPHWGAFWRKVEINTEKMFFHKKNYNQYNRLVLNESTFLRFEIINELFWTKTYLVSNNTELYLGAELYNNLYKKLYKGFIKKKIFYNKKDKYFDFAGNQYKCVIVLLDPYVCVCRTKNKKDFNVLFLGDYNKVLGKIITVKSSYLRFE